MRSYLVLLFWAIPLFAQSNSGELRLKVTDPDGLGVKSSVQLVSEVNQLRKTSGHGRRRKPRRQAASFRRLPSGSAARRFRSILRFNRNPIRGPRRISRDSQNHSAEYVRHRQRCGHADRSPSLRHDQSNWQGHNCRQSDFATRPLAAGSGEFPTRLALRGQCRFAPARLGISDSACG